MMHTIRHAARCAAAAVRDILHDIAGYRRWVRYFVEAGHDPRTARALANARMREAGL